MNSKAEISINSMVFGMVICFGLFFAVIGGTINDMSDNYDVTGFNETELNSYNHLQDLETRVTSRVDEVTGVNVETKWYDWFAGLWNKLKGSFVFVVQSYTGLIDVTKQASGKFQLMPEFEAAITTIVVLLVVFGLLAARYFLGRK